MVANLPGNISLSPPPSLSRGGGRRPVVNDASAGARALSLLDKGLRSLDVGLQAKAVMHFPSLLDDFPYPIVVNAAFLKLADLFRGGDNFLRLLVLQVFQRSEKQLYRVSSIEDVVHRVFAVAHSNDLIARALTLRVLGSIAILLADQAKVQHSVQVGLDANHPQELSAAIHAVERLCACSPSFAYAVFDKLSCLLAGLNTPPEMKLRISRVFRHMHGDVTAIQKSQGLCLSLLERYRTTDFTCSLLNTLTCLILRSSSEDIITHVSLLMTYLGDKDQRRRVKLAALHGLSRIAAAVPHLLTSEHADALLRVAIHAHHTSVQAATLFAIRHVARSAVHVDLLGSPPTSPSYEGITLCCLASSNLPVSALAAQILSIMVVRADDTVCANIVYGLVTLICVALARHVISVHNETGIISSDDEKYVRIMVGSALRIAACHQTVAGNVACAIADLVPLVHSAGTLKLLYQGFIRVSASAPEAAHKLLEPVLSSWRQATRAIDNDVNFEEDNENNSDMLLLACQSLLELEQHDIISAIMEEAVATNDWWLCYRLARAAVLGGEHQLAQFSFAAIAVHASRQASHFWLSALARFSEAEALLSAESSARGLSRAVSLALPLFADAEALLHAASVSSPDIFRFQRNYVALRARYASCVGGIAAVLLVLCAIAPEEEDDDVYDNNLIGSDLSQSRILELRGHTDTLEAVTAGYGTLQHSIFAIDAESLRCLEADWTACGLLNDAISTLLLPTIEKSGKSMKYYKVGEKKQRGGDSRTVRGIETVSRQAADNIRNYMNQSRDSVNNRCSSTRARVARDIVVDLCTQPACTPPFFFRAGGSPALQLSIVAPDVSVLPIARISRDEKLVVKIEAVIANVMSSTASRRGTVHRVGVVVDVVHGHDNEDIAAGQRKSSDLAATSFTAPIPSDEPKCAAGRPLFLSVVPHRQFFTLDVGVALPHTAAKWTVCVDSFIIDKEGTVWNVGIQACVKIEVE